MEKLKQVLAQEDTVLFVGSGISLWSDLPSWSQFIEELATFVEASGAKAELIRAEAQRGDLLQAASYGFHKLTKQQIGEFVRKACRYGVAKPHEIHRKLVSLGPRCFITTNYDNLIEESLRIWQPDRFLRPPVTNRHLTEIADIVHARAIDFVFKPHGDAGDSDSIILTREQYRQLLPGGERHAALESVKILLASRPVVYIGFGLRDPDFMYVRDLLSNTYKGGTRDHYATMADILEGGIDYWRTNYGIHLVGYATIERADKSRDHGAFLKLLDDLLIAAPTTLSFAAVSNAPCSPDMILALARHAGRIARTPKSNPEFPIRVHLEKDNRPKRAFDLRVDDEFDHYSVERFLDEGPTRALLTGPPGSGKTYSFQRAATRLAERLHEMCLSEIFDEKSVIIPLLADLKLYRGSLDDLVNRTLPNSLSLDALVQRFKVKILLDSFNEMPREYWENGSYEEDFAQFVGNAADASIFIGSRTNDGLSKTGFPSYCLDEIDERFVAAELERLKIDVRGRFEREVRSLLKMPFYFQLVASRTVSLPEEAHPGDFFQKFFNGLVHSFEERFGQPFNLERALSLAAYDAINRGEEAQPLADVLQILKTELEGASISEIRAQDAANWLVSRSVLIPYRGGRIAFFHQSVTEYLAAGELSRRYQASPNIVKEKLSLTRWDQTLLLTLSFLSPDEAAAFLQTIVETDFALALKATKYLEFGREEVVAKLLSEIPGRIEADRQFDRGIESGVEFGLPISDVHEPHLRALMKRGDSIGAAAVTRLVELKGASVKDELLQSLVEARDDYNYGCNGIGRALQRFASADDVRKIVALADSIQGEFGPDADDKVAHGFTNGAAAFLEALDLSFIREGFLPEDDGSLSEVRARILCHILWNHHSTAALDLAGELLLRGVDNAATAIYFISNFAKPEDRLSWDSFTSDHVERLVSKVGEKDESWSLRALVGEKDESWSLRALKCLCEARPDIAQVVRGHASKAYGITKAALLYCASAGEQVPVFEALAELAEMGIEERSEQPAHLLKQIKLEWAGHEKLFVQLLRLRDTRLALALTNGLEFDCPIGELEIGAIDWWLEWFMEERGTKSGYWFCYKMAWLFARFLNADARQSFVAEFNKSGSKFRRLLAHSILPRLPDLTTDAFTEDAISFLLADLKRGGSSDYYPFRHLLGSTATEQFVTEHLLPLVAEAKPPLSGNLRKALRDAGSRHGKRYVAG